MPATARKDIGENETDIGRSAKAEQPISAVVSILVNRLCSKPHRMPVKPRSRLFLQGERLWPFTTSSQSFNGPNSVAVWSG